ncbi:SDR family oxidoreductase [Nocardioides sp. TRM66260-LWL]|uniref:SDR family oxidoreductase n=1 Tax=Nocardioides sp. TRM66260-LWL TaxID=2874478 RepID=UPI001CC3AF42|nr:SDR family oxidoreductase [Nocardioides sp. TRM66260-LWL]MBZ5734754.1 SDR family oxidoreductase [Nocardioides sp. TRM66260-LWL]
MSILDRFALTDHVAVVTGAGRGIGAATAVALAQAGADVVISARTAAQLDVVAEAVRAAGRRALVVPADLADTDAVAGLAHAAFEEFGRLDTVVNNVGGTIPNAFLDTDVAYLEEAFHFNVSTAHALSRAAVPLMLRPLPDGSGDGDDASRQRSIVAISSMMGRAAGRGYLAYGTAKAALAHWARLAATDLAPQVRVNGIFVGSVMTSALEFVAAMPEMMDQMETKTPLGRVGEAEDIAAGVLYLASRAGQYVTGKLLEIDGGIQQPNLDLGLPDLRPRADEAAPAPAGSPA